MAEFRLLFRSLPPWASIERFFGILVENTAGEFPFWLAPTQLKLLPVTDGVVDFCKEVAKKAQKAGIRVEVDRGTERLGKQIRNAEKARIPIMAVVGMKEMETWSSLPDPRPCLVKIKD